MCRRILLSVTAVALLGFAQSAGAQELLPQDATPAKNVILILATGMGDHQCKLLEAIAKYEERTSALQRCEKRLRLKTGILDSPLPDTAGGGSTLATGRKCPPGRLSVTPDGVPLQTLLEQAQQSGRSVGLVTLGPLTNGAITPFAVHSNQPGDLEARARQLFEARIPVLVGNDLEVFRNARDAKGRPLLQRMEEEGYSVIEGHRRDFLNVKKAPLAAFFNHTFRADRRHFPQEPGLQQILFKVFSILKENPKGFFLVVETPALDRSCRIGDTSGVAYEMLELEKAVEAGLRFAENTPQTLICVTSPHETGNFLTIEDELPRFVKRFRSIQCSPVYADRKMGESPSLTEIMRTFRDVIGIKFLNKHEIELVSKAEPGPKRAGGVAKVISHQLAGGHLAQDAPSGRSVPCFVQGPGASLWPETIENSELAVLLRRQMGLPGPEETSKDSLRH